MRTINAALTTEQQAASRAPHITAIIENLVQAVRRHDFAVLNTTSNAVEKHDVAVGSNGNVHRVRMQGGAVKYQRETSPASATWTTWTDLAVGRGLNVAVAALSTNLVIVIYTDAAETTIYYRESINGGSSFGAEQTLAGGLASAVTDLGIAYKASGGGDFMAAWSNAAANVGQRRRVSGVLQAVAFWTAAAQNQLNGIAIAHTFQYELAVTGREITTEARTLWTIEYNEGAGTWSTLRVQFQAHKDALTEFAGPSLAYADTWRLNFAERPTYTGGVTRSWRSWLAPTLLFTSGPYAWRTPEPHTDTNTHGVAIGYHAGHNWLYESAPALVQRADHTTVTDDVSADIVALDLREAPGEAGATLDLDNSSGQYAGPPSPITIGNHVQIAFGYYTPAAGNQASEVLSLWIAGYEYLRDGGKSIIRLRLESGWDILRRTLERTDLYFTGVSYLGIIQRACNRAGLIVNTASASVRASTTNPVAWRIGAAESGYAAVRRALALLTDRMFMTADAGVRLTEPLTTDLSDYTIGLDHALHRLQLRDESIPVAQLRVIGTGVYRDVIDAAAVRHLLSPSAVLRDLSSTTSGAADASGLAARRQLQMAEANGSAVVPPICGLELLDVIDLADGLVSGSAILRRVVGIRWRYERRREIYEQEITLGPI
jgi:hypothetical protein